MSNHVRRGRTQKQRRQETAREGLKHHVFDRSKLRRKVGGDEAVRQQWNEEHKERMSGS